VITLVLGGARSGKSAFAEELASHPEVSGGVIYIATADALDDEMTSRISKHRDRRPRGWATWDGETASLPSEMKNIASSWDVLLLDSLTMYLSCAFLAAPEADGGDEALWSAAEGKIIGEMAKIFSSFKEASSGTQKSLIVVSDETGCGIVPSNRMGRRFRDLQGRANQVAARHADEAALVVAGMPLWIKRHEPGK
jgi:adenosylcobinamide kinase/adenosylcobinamide-phosphate guanylyltransferase